MRRRRRFSGTFSPEPGKQLRVIPFPVIREILEEPFLQMEKSIRDQVIHAKANDILPIWEKEWLEVKEKYPTFAASVQLTVYPQSWWGHQVPSGYPVSGPKIDKIEAQTKVPTIPSEPLPHLVSELRWVFPSLVNYIKFYYSDLDIRLPEARNPEATYTISEEFKSIVKQATAHLTVLRASKKKE